MSTPDEFWTLYGELVTNKFTNCRDVNSAMRFNEKIANIVAEVIFPECLVEQANFLIALKNAQSYQASQQVQPENLFVRREMERVKVRFGPNEQLTEVMTKYDGSVPIEILENYTGIDGHLIDYIESTDTRVHKSWKMIGCAYVYYFARPEKGWLGEFRLVQRSYKYQ